MGCTARSPRPTFRRGWGLTEISPTRPARSSSAPWPPEVRTTSPSWWPSTGRSGPMEPLTFGKVGRAFVDYPGQAVEQDSRLDRFLENLVGPSGQEGPGGVREASSRGEDHAGGLLGRDARQLVVHVHARGIRHHQIAHDGVETISLPDEVQGLSARRAADALVGAQQTAIHRQDGGLVVDDQEEPAIL